MRQVYAGVLGVGEDPDEPDAAADSDELWVDEHLRRDHQGPYGVREDDRV